MPTRLAELRRAAAFPREADDRHHLGPDAGAPLGAAGGAGRRVRLAAVVPLQRAHVPAQAGAFGQVPPSDAHLSALHFGRKDTVGQRSVTSEESKKEKTQKAF